MPAPGCAQESEGGMSEILFAAIEDRDSLYASMAHDIRRIRDLESELSECTKARARALALADQLAGHSHAVYLKGFDDGKEAERKRCMAAVEAEAESIREWGLTEHLHPPGSWSMLSACDNIRREIEGGENE